MKILLSILLFLISFESFGQPPADDDTGYIVRLSEYTNGLFLRRPGNVNNGKLYTIFGNATPTGGVTAGVFDAGAGFHNFAYIDSAGFPHTYGVDNLNGQAGIGTTGGSNYGPTIISTDSAGNTFNNNAKIYSTNELLGANMYSIRNNGDVFGWGYLGGGLRGITGYASKNYTKPVQIPFPEPIVELAPSLLVLALGATGNLYQLGGGDVGFFTQYINPQGTGTPDTLHAYLNTALSPARRIAGGYYYSYVETSAGQLWAATGLGGWTGIGAPGNTNSQQPSATNVWVRVDTSLGLVPGDFPLKDLKINGTTGYLITKFGVLRAWGDAVNGTLGDSTHLPMSTYTNSGTPQPYQWNQSINPSQLFKRKSVVVGPGISFWKIYTSVQYTYNVYVKDVNGQLYSFGRNKGGVNGNGIVPCETSGNLIANYPNSWDDSLLRPVNPLTVVNHPTTSPICITNPAATSCNLGTCPFVAHANPTANLGSNRTVTVGQSFTLDGTASTPASTYFINGYKVTHISGPNAPIIQAAFPVQSISHSVTGTDVYGLSVIDNYFLSGSTTMTVTTISGNCNCSYYFSASGSDANSCTLASPCQTITKLNSLSSDTTASFYLNRGDSFFGGISNFAGHRLDAYGSGSRPIVTGFITLSSWSVVSGNVYQAACSGCNVNTNLVLVNGVQQQMGRTPNTGYYTYQSHSGQTTITSSSLTGTPNYSGGQVVIRSCNACLATNNITSQSGSTLTYTSAAGQTPTDNFGLFIINDSLTLDTAYEWYYSPGLAQMKMYFPSGPSGITVQTTAVDTLLYIASGEKNDTITNIDFEGAGICGICMSTDTGILIRNVKIRYSGGLGHYAVRAVNSRIDSSHISYCNDQGILIDSASVNHYIGYDTARTAGYIVGQARTLQGDDYRGITNKSHLGVIEYNRVDSTGYDGIMGYQYSSIYKNYVNKFCFVMDDGGGIYSLGYKIGADTARLQYIRGNVLANGIGASAGTNNLTFKPAYGVYTDNNNVNVIVDSNTIDSMAHSGIFNHNSRLIVTRNNTVYASAVAALQVQGDDATKPVRQNTTKKNYFGINQSNQQTIRFVSFNNIQFTATYGTLDSNYYFYSNLNATPFLSYPSTFMAIKQWQDSTGETHPTIFVAPTLFQYNSGLSSVPLALSGKNYWDALYKSYYNSATLPPLGSLMLFPGSFTVYPWGTRFSLH